MVKVFNCFISMLVFVKERSELQIAWVLYIVLLALRSSVTSVERSPVDIESLILVGQFDQLVQFDNVRVQLGY